MADMEMEAVKDRFTIPTEDLMDLVDPKDTRKVRRARALYVAPLC